MAEQYCRLGEHMVDEVKWIKQVQSCVECYNVAQFGTGSFCHQLNPIDHFRLTTAGYFYSSEKGYQKI